MKLNEWKDSNGNKITSGPVVSNQTSSGSSNTGYKKRFEKLLDYLKTHKGPAVSKIKIATCTEDGFMYTEERKGGYSFYDLDIQVYIGQQTEAWRLRAYIDNRPDADMSGMGYTNLLKQLRQYINVPTTGTPEYKDILTEWVDKTGKKVSLNPPTVKTSSGATKTNKEKFKELTDYMIKHRGSLTAKAEVIRLDDYGFIYKEHWEATAASGKGYVLTLLVGFGRGQYYNDWKYELYLEESLAEKGEGTGMADLLKELDKYFHVPKVGSPEHQKLCEWLDSNGKKVSTSSANFQSAPKARPLNTVYYEGGSVAKKVRENAQRIIVTSKVSEIYANTFFDCKEVQEIILPEILKRIGNFAFSQCYNLTKINLPSSISYIAEEAFYNCKNLTIHCDQGSYADQFAKDHNIPVVYNTSTVAEDFKEYENLWD